MALRRVRWETDQADAVSRSRPPIGFPTCWARCRRCYRPSRSGGWPTGCQQQDQPGGQQQGGQLLGGLGVADALPTQPATVVLPQHGGDQVLGAHVGGVRLGGDAEGLREVNRRAGLGRGSVGVVGAWELS
jgi:hypothetical protein